MKKNMLVIVSLLSFSGLGYANANNLEQASLDLEQCLNEDFDTVDGMRGGAIDQDYDAICDQMPVIAMSKWQSWLNSIGGTFMLRAVLCKRFVTNKYAAFKKSVKCWLVRNKSKKVVS